MTALQPTPSRTAADVQAQRNWLANRAAVAASHPWLPPLAEALPTSVTWVFGRDGFLTAQDSAGHWWAGCSLPKRVGETMLKKLELHGVVGCLLAPTHAGQVAAALEKLSLRQAIVVILTEAQDLDILLACCDFSADLRQYRLWFAVGEQWPAMLADLFGRQPGLSTPSQFIRTPATSEDLIQQLIPQAESVLRTCNDDRSRQIEALLAHPQSSVLRPQSLLLAPSHFRLWDDAGAALAGAVPDAHHVDPDDPAQSSALGLALAAQNCRALIAANRSRADLPQVVRPEVPVISWVTQPRLPAFDAQHPNDALLLADESWLPLAQAAGWPRHRLELAGWPSVDLAPATHKCIALIADTFTLETPVTQLDASSHHVLWEMIRADLAADPFCLGPELHGFIDRRMAKLGIAEEGFDRAMFIEKLIVPAYQQGLLKLLLDAGLPLKIFGNGWDQIPRLRSVWQGPIPTRAAFQAAVESSSLLIYPWPARSAQQIDALGRVVLFPNIRRAENWIRDAKAALIAPPARRSLPAISAAILNRLIDAGPPAR